MFHHVFLLKRDVPLSNLLATSGGDVLCEPSRFAPEPSTALVSKDYNSVGVMARVRCGGALNTG